MIHGKHCSAIVEHAELLSIKTDTEQIIHAVTTTGIPFGFKIIASFGDGSIIGKTDGVVAYESAHIEGAAAELVVRSGHSSQGRRETIENVGAF